VDAEGRGSVDGSPSLGPAVTLSLDWETYVRLAAGRVRHQDVGDRVKTEGDAELAQAILDNFAVTP
ncbi:SCP2 sterol-binding domain-containing protein, partial [Streptomyces sp. ADI96-15]